LISQGKDWTYDIAGDCPGKRCRCCILQKNTESGSVKKDMIEKRGKISILPLKLDESQALVQGR
jgi:hypothetical protein